MTEQQNRVSRRTVLKTTGVAATIGVAGCSGGGGGDTNEVEIVHWWTAGGEADAIEALIQGFEEEHSDLDVTNNPAPGGAGSALDTEMTNRVINENAPSSFQIWPGKALNTYLDSDILADIGDVWDQEMEDAYLDGVKELSKDSDGNYVCVPLNIHRLNNLFYNVDVVESAGVDPTTIDSPGALLNAMETIDAETDAAPMAQQTQAVWSTLQLWEDVLLGMSDVDTYLSVLDGDVSGNEQAVRGALQMVVDYEEYFNADAGSIAWDEANGQVIQGDAAFIHQGDWAAGQYNTAEDFEFGDNWDYVPFPGTDGVYHIVADSFVMPTPNPSPDATEEWLSYCGSVDGQEQFNPIKGSIPPRTDVPNDNFGPFLTSQRDDFDTSGDQPPTIAHGTGVTPEVKSNVENGFASFTGSWNADSMYDRLTEAL